MLTQLSIVIFSALKSPGKYFRILLTWKMCQIFHIGFNKISYSHTPSDSICFYSISTFHCYQSITSCTIPARSLSSSTDSVQITIFKVMTKVRFFCHNQLSYDKNTFFGVLSIVLKICPFFYLHSFTDLFIWKIILFLNLKKIDRFNNIVSAMFTTYLISTLKFRFEKKWWIQ